LREILLVPISRSQEPPDGPLDHRAQSIMEGRRSVGISGANARQQLTVVEGR